MLRSSLMALAAVFVAAPLLAQSPPAACAIWAACSATPAGTPAYAPAARLIDINTATKAELESLPGVGAARVEAIVKGRPYKGRDELVRRKILPQNVYDAIKDRIVARQA